MATPTKAKPITKAAQTRRTAPGSSAKAKAAISKSAAKPKPAASRTTAQQGAASQATKPQAVEALTELTEEVIAAMNPVDRNKVAGEEQKARKEAQAKGEPEPATPVLDWMNRHDAATRRSGTRTTNSGKKGTPRVKMQFARNGKPITNPSVNSLSGVAYFYTKGIDGDAPRISTDRLVEVLKGLGVENPRTEPFEAKLPNGTVISATLPEGAAEKKAAGSVKPPRRSDKRTSSARSSRAAA